MRGGMFFKALGDTFSGYAKDQSTNFERARVQKADAEDSALRNAQIGKIQQEESQSSFLRSPQFQDLYVKARAGDENAIAQVASIVAGHPNASAILSPLVRPPKEDPKPFYDSDRGVLVSPNGQVTRPAGLPPKPIAQGTTTEPSWQVVQTDNGLVQVNPKTGESRPVRDPSGKPMQAPLPSSVKESIATNTVSLATIDKAINALKAHPKAVGIFRGRSDDLDQRVDPEGVEARSALADVGSLQIKTRSGQSVTASEWPRIAPLVARISDNYETAMRKLTMMRARILDENAALSAGHDVSMITGATQQPAPLNTSGRNAPTAPNPFAAPKPNPPGGAIDVNALISKYNLR